MKTHTIFALFAAMILTACASHRGRDISSTKDAHQTEIEQSRSEGNMGRDFMR